MSQASATSTSTGPVRVQQPTNTACSTHTRHSQAVAQAAVSEHAVLLEEDLVSPEMAGASSQAQQAGDDVLLDSNPIQFCA